VVKASTSDDPEIKAAAIDVLGTLGDVSVLRVLLDAAVSGDESIEQVARESLAELKGDRVDEAVFEQLRESEGDRLVVLVETIGRRGISAAIPQLLELMGEEDVDRRNAAIEALAMTVGADELPEMVDRLFEDVGATTGETPLKDALRKACQRMPDRDAAAAVLLQRMEGASPEAKAQLLDLLIYVGGEKALEGIAEAARSGDDALADAATEALGKWLTPDVAPVLLELAKSGDEKYRVRCLRGYIRVIRQFGLRPGQRLQMSKLAFNTATRDEERKLVLDTLTRFPSPAALRMSLAHLGDEALREDACKASVTICEKIVDSDRKAVAEAMPTVLAAISDEELTDRAKVVIKRADAD
jgi:HEAT repeat protein